MGWNKEVGIFESLMDRPPLYLELRLLVFFVADVVVVVNEVLSRCMYRVPISDDGPQRSIECVW